MNAERSGQAHQATGLQAVGEAEGTPSGASTEPEKPCCCCVGGAQPADIVQEPPNTNLSWVSGILETAVGTVPQVETRLRAADRLGAWRVRWGIGRMRYRVDPGLYAVGQPTAESPVLVSANYKMSFDRLRSCLAGIDAWILVLDTKGVNVWCAAGKGTFGTAELAGRLQANRLGDLVSHRTLVVPQLGAPGIAAHQVTNRCGFRVTYGPVRAADLPAFLTGDMRATPAMRRVEFPFLDRLVLVPVELVRWAKHAAIAALAILLLSGFGPGGYSWDRMLSIGPFSAALLLATYVGASVLGPALLPWLPGRALALKGACLGILFVPLLTVLNWLNPALPGNWLTGLGWALWIPAIASFVTMSFVGSTTYTSLSGVRREMWIAMPLQALAAVVGAACWLVGRFV